ncbi:MAG: Rieske 2Fe-2S domain-containing protein [Opitutaceae bacterium]|nr:Rieske 2Fe-2S domain-containing protein [Opitutaceae bacterium]
MLEAPALPLDSFCRLPRRKFLALASGCLLCGAAGVPTVRAGTDRPIDVGTLHDYPRDEISEKYIEYDIFVIRNQRRLFAATAICPHKANALLLSPKDPRLIICSGHESRFNPEGIPVGGQARRALVRHAISVNERSRVIVDTSRKFLQPEWDDKASYVVIG